MPFLEPETHWIVLEHPWDRLLLPIALYAFLLGLYVTLHFCDGAHRKSETGCGCFKSHGSERSHFSVLRQILIVCLF